MYVKLQSGFFEPSQIEGEVPRQLDKKCLIVYAGTFDSMDGKVTVQDEDIEKLAERHNSLLSKVTRMATGDIPLKYCPPLQLDHSVLSTATIGRVYGPLEVGQHTTEDGKVVKALYGVIRVLGQENVEKVMDGRWTHLSIGADFEEGKFQELTVTPFPAASDASMLSKVKVQKDNEPNELQGGNHMFEKLKAFLMRSKKLSEKDADEHMKHMGDEEKKHLEMAEQHRDKMKHYLKEHKKMSEEDAEKHLSEMDVEGHKKLAAEVDEHEKKMAAEKPKDEEHLKKMSAAKEALTKLSTDFRSNAKAAELTMKKASILSRLSKLQAEAKITPAETKKVDLAKLSGESQATIDAVLKSYEDREPVIMTGIVGSKKGVDASEAYHGKRMSQLEAETRANMTLLAKTAPKPAKRLGEKEEEHVVNVNVDEEGHRDAEMAKQHLAMVHSEGDKHMEMANEHMEAGNIEKAKEHMKKLMEHYRKHLEAAYKGQSMEGMEDSHKALAQMSALAESVTRMQNEFEQVMKLADSVVGSDSK